MGPGHFGVAMAAKPLAPKAPLWLLLIASEGIDLLFFLFSFIGLEKQAVSRSSIERGIEVITPGILYWSHGLFMAIIWSIAAFLLTYFFLKEQRAALIVGLVFFSHWILDFIVHTPDLPLFFVGSPNVGLGLWGSGPGLIISGILEILLLSGGLFVYLYWRKSRPTN